MSRKRPDQRKAKRREDAKRAERRRRMDADRCGELLSLAELALSTRDLPRARRVLENVLHIRPTHQIAHEYLAEVDFVERRFEQGLIHYDRLVRRPEWLPLIYKAALACLQTGNFNRGMALAGEFLAATRGQSSLAELRRTARVLKRECAKAARLEATRARRSAPAAGSIAPLFERMEVAEADVSAAEPRSAAPPRSPEAHDPAAALPPFPELTPGEIVVDVEAGRGDFPERVAWTDVAPVAEVDLRRQWAELRLQKGFDELLSLGATRDVTQFRFQLESVRRILRDFRGRVLLADEVGLGKTIEACLALKEYWMRGLVRKALILVPPSLVSQWVDELTSRFGLTPATPDSPASRRDPEGFWTREPLVVASIALARQPAHRERLRTIDYDLVIVDEAHVLKRRTSAAWQLVNDLKKRFLLLLSATPVGNDLAELYNLILLLRPGLLRTEAQFRREYGQVDALKQAARRDKLRALLREVMIRNTRAHIDLKLPRRLAATQVVHPGPAEAAALAQLAAVIRDRYATADSADRWRWMMLQMQAGSSPAALRFGLRDRRGAPDDGLDPILAALESVEGSAKTDALIELARRSRDKKIVFTRFRATLDHLAEALTSAGFRTVMFHGGLTASDKDAAIAAFEADAEILLSSEIGGQGRNLQFCRTVINFDLPWNPMAIEQRVGRVHRIGQTRDVYVFNFCLAGSIEERILRILHDKINLFELVAGEVEMILGHLDDDQDFAGMVMDVWARSRTPGEEAQAFDELSDAILRARTEYQRTQDLDRALFSEDYEA